MSARAWLASFAIVGVALASSCIPDEPREGFPTYGTVGVVTLPDGTPCAVYDGWYGAGIDCNWPRP